MKHFDFRKPSLLGHDYEVAAGREHLGSLSARLRPVERDASCIPLVVQGVTRLLQGLGPRLGNCREREDVPRGLKGTCAPSRPPDHPGRHQAVLQRRGGRLESLPLQGRHHHVQQRGPLLPDRAEVGAGPWGAQGAPRARGADCEGGPAGQGRGWDGGG